MRLRFCAASHPGLRRHTNEDSYCVRPDLGLFAVADGVGGHAAGEIASRAALEALERSPFDLLVRDLGLPDRTGLELLRELRGRGERLPAIALSGYGQERDIERSREAGFAEHLVKPVEPRVVLDAIARAMRL